MTMLKKERKRIKFSTIYLRGKSLLAKYKNQSP